MTSDADFDLVFWENCEMLGSLFGQESQITEDTGIPDFELEIPKTKPGRSKNLLNKFLDSFRVLDKNSFKRDNIRTKFVRGHKKLMNKVKMQCTNTRWSNPDEIRPPKEKARRDYKNQRISVLHSFDYTDHHERHIWKELVNVYLENSSVFDLLITTGFAGFRSFKTEFFQNYFANEAVWNSFHMFLDLIFTDRHPLFYIERFNVSCCGIGTIHGENCKEKWHSLHLLLANRNFWTLNELI